MDCMDVWCSHIYSLLILSCIAAATVHQFPRIVLSSLLTRSQLFLYSQPLDVVLGLLGDELDSLQDIGYVVDASLLDI